ncbi:hypothetical protein PflCFBP13514_04375 [Pseudomonas fluorescens]|nr:hypothetical protein PflCFBP13514_04375 [Pseudomonas fluorescens]
MLLAYLWIGVIPYNDGAGWDGDVYVAYVKSLAAGIPISGDPYRSIRLSGFLQLVPFAWGGSSKATLVLIQMLFNTGLMAIGTGCLFSCLRTLGVESRKAIFSVALMTISWAGMVMPIFYPVLSDNLAIPICCIALWCWANNRNVPLYIMCGWFVWLFPGLFLVPLGLITFPFKREENLETIQFPHTVKKSLFALFFITGLVIYYFLMKNITTTNIAAHMANGGSTAVPSLIPISILIQCMTIAILAWIGARILCLSQIYQSIRLSGLLLGIFIVSASYLVMSLTINFSTGFQGPPLLDNLMMQGAAAPLKTWVAHFLYFGFFVPLVAAHCIQWSLRGQPGIPLGLLIVFIAFFPFMSFGSESRQWVGIIPVAIAIYALVKNTRKQQIFMIVISMISLFTLHGLRSNTEVAVERGLAIQSYEWQYYFGRQGPWMSVDVYELSLMALIAVAALYLWLGAIENRPLAAPTPH